MNKWTLFEIAVNIYQGILMIYFMRKILTPRLKHYWYDALFVMLIALFLSSYLFVSIPFVDTVVFVLPFGFAMCVSRDRVVAKLFWTVVLAVLFIGITNITIAFCTSVVDLPLEVIMSANHQRISCVVGCNLLILLCLFLIVKASKRESVISWPAFMMFVVLMGLLLFTEEVLFELSTEKNEEDLRYVMANLAIFASAILAFILYEVMAIATSRRLQAEMEVQAMQNVVERQKDIQGMYQGLIKYQHDMKHRISVLESLVTQQDNVEHIQPLLDEIRNENVLYPEFATGSLAVDALLTAKKALMDQEEIEFEFIPYPLHELPMKEGTFCVILANLLDNAIEAIQRLPVRQRSRKILLSFARSWDMFYLVCENDMLPHSINKDGDRFISSKGSLRHGHGIESITNICEQHGGKCRFEYTTDKFAVHIRFPYM